jgi:hypothetical protein
VEGGLARSRRQQLTKICNYLRRHQARMRYDEYLAAGYPIASGVIEGAWPSRGQGSDGAGGHALDDSRCSSLTEAALCGPQRGVGGVHALSHPAGDGPALSACRVGGASEMVSPHGSLMILARATGYAHRKTKAYTRQDRKIGKYSTKQFWLLKSKSTLSDEKERDTGGKILYSYAHGRPERINQRCNPPARCHR